jgi:hypothetical protein
MAYAACPNNMVGGGHLLLFVSPIISNIKLYHVLVDGGMTLNLISLTAFKKLQILMSKLTPSRPFSGVGLVSVMPRGSISLLVTFGMHENYHMESVLFDIREVNLPFNAILGTRVLKMSMPNGIIKIRGDHMAGVFALEKL